MFNAKYLSSSSFGFFKRRFFNFLIYIRKSNGAGPILTPGLLSFKVKNYGRRTYDGWTPDEK
jgi:hypothetical protein